MRDTEVSSDEVLKVYNYTERSLCAEQMQCEKDNTCRLQQFVIISLLVCFLFSTFGHRRPHFLPNRIWSRCDLRFGQSTIHP